MSWFVDFRIDVAVFELLNVRCQLEGIFIQTQLADEYHQPPDQHVPLL